MKFAKFIDSKTGTELRIRADDVYAMRDDSYEASLEEDKPIVQQTRIWVKNTIFIVKEQIDVVEECLNDFPNRDAY